MVIKVSNQGQQPTKCLLTMCMYFPQTKQAAWVYARDASKQANRQEQQHQQQQKQSPKWRYIGRARKKKKNKIGQRGWSFSSPLIKDFLGEPFSLFVQCFYLIQHYYYMCTVQALSTYSLIDLIYLLITLPTTFYMPPWPFEGHTLAPSPL